MLRWLFWCICKVFLYKHEFLVKISNPASIHIVTITSVQSLLSPWTINSSWDFPKCTFSMVSAKILLTFSGLRAKYYPWGDSCNNSQIQLQLFNWYEHNHNFVTCLSNKEVQKNSTSVKTFIIKSCLPLNSVVILLMFTYYISWHVVTLKNTTQS